MIRDLITHKHKYSCKNVCQSETNENKDLKLYVSLNLFFSLNFYIVSKSSLSHPTDGNLVT